MSNSENLTQYGDDDLLSALVDGELSSPEVLRACARWRDDGEAQARWQSYQLIGDVLRSEDLASRPGHDENFLARLRERLAEEPVVLAPAALAATASQASSGRRRWRTSLAIAAGSSAALAALLLIQMPNGWRFEPASMPGQVVAAGAAPTIRPASLALTGPDSSLSAEPARKLRGASAATPAIVLDGQFIRNARLDEYLAAHKKFGGSSQPGGPSGFLRNATAEGR